MPNNPYQVNPFDVNKYKQIDQQMFGPKAFDFSNVQKTVQMQAQADALRKQALSLYQQRLHPPKPKKPKVEKKTYQDAVDYIRNNKDQFLKPYDPITHSQPPSGAYQIANDIRNDPAKQAAIRAQGYNVTDFINALYAGLSDGSYRSEREYNQHVTQQKKDLKDNPYAPKLNNINKPNHDKQQSGFLNNVGGVFKDVGHDVSQKLSGAGNELANIWKAISDGPGGYTLKDVAKDTQKNIKKDQATNAKRGYSSNLSKEIHRGANRAMDAATLNNLSAFQNAENTKGYNYNTDYANTRKFGKGGATDFITSGLGYLVPGDAALNAVKLGGIGERSAALLGKKLSPSLANIASKGAEGSAVGGAFGTMQSIADPNMTAKQRLLNIPLNAGLGAVADPVLNVAGSRIARFFGKNKVAKSELDNALNNPNTPNDVKQEILALPSPKVAGYLNEGQRLALPEGKTVGKPRYASPTNQTNGEILALPPHNPSANQILDYLLPKIKPEVEQAMTPPLENPRELKKWIREHTDIPVKQLDTLPPKDLQDMAIQVRNSLRVPDVAQEIAHKYGYDLEALLNGQVNDMNGVIARRNFAETAGVPQNKLNMDILNNPQVGNTFKPKERYVPIDKQPLNFVGKNTQPLSLKVQPVIKETPPLNFSKKAIMDKNLVNPLRTKLNPNKEVAATVEKKVKKNPEYINASSDPGLVKASTKNAELEKLLSNSENWKDKGNISYGRETMDRNFEDVMGKDAPQMKKVFLDPIKTNETIRVKFLNAERQQVKSYGIKPKSQDDKLVQMYGEGKITLDELKQQTPNWKKVVKVANAYRAKYDELLTTVNKVLEANGYDPIPKRANYFPHYEEIDNMLSKLGFDMNNNMLPTDINGLTDSFKPGKSFFRNALQRKGDQTTYGAIEGFDKYIEGISNVIYHTKDIKNIRSLEKAIRNKYEGDTHLSNFVTQLDEYGNILAGKKSKIDRAAEFVMGRKVYNALDTIRRRTGANIIGANVSSALTNFIPFTHSLATTDKKAFAKAMLDTLTNVVRKDGIVHDSGFLTRRIGSDPLYRNLWDKTVDKTMWLMKTVDNFTSQVVVRSKYYEGLKNGLSPEQAMKQADDWASKIMADRSKGQMPPWFNSKTLGVLSQFQLEVNNQLSFMLKDIPRTMDKKAMASAFGQIVLYSYLFNNVYEKMMGRRPAFDPLGVALQAYKDYNNDNITKSKASVNLFENVANQLPFSSTFTGGRYPISAGLPSIPNLIDAAKQGQFSQQLKKEAVKPLFDLLPPAGGNQVKKTYEGLSALSKGGEYLGNKMKYPISNTPANALRGALFGKYAFPESNQYYNDNRRILDAKQTKRVENSSNPKQTYEQIQFNRRETTLVNQIKKVMNSNESQKVKGQKLNELQKRLQKLQGGR